MASALCSNSWLMLSNTSYFRLPVTSNLNESKVCRQVSVPHSSTQKITHLDAVNSFTFRTLKARSISTGALPALGFTGAKSGKFLIVRAESQGLNGNGVFDVEQDTSGVDGQIGDDESDEGSSTEENTFAATILNFSRDFLLELKNETGFDSAVAKDHVLDMYRALRERSGGAVATAKEELERVRNQARNAALVVRHRYWPQFVKWNGIELWKDRRQWDAQRVGAFVFYVLFFGAFLRGAQQIVTAPRKRREAAKLAEAYLETVIREPTPANVRKLRKAMWRASMPEGFRMRKYTLREDGEYEHDISYVGEFPEERFNESDVDANKLIDESDKFTAEEKEELKREIAEAKSSADMEPIDADERVRVRVDIGEVIDLIGEGTPEQREELKQQIAEAKARHQAASVHGKAGIQPGLLQKRNWRERLAEWRDVLEKASIKDFADSFTSKYYIVLSWPEVVARVKAVQLGELRARQRMRAFWVAKKWWKYRPKLPYTYLWDKVEDQEVKAAVYTEDMRKLYVTMKHGFPSEFVVDLPVDPDLYDLLKTSGVEVDILHRSNLFYYSRVAVALLPSFLIIWYLRKVQYFARQRASEKIYDLLSMNREHLILPEDAPDKARSQYKDVVLGGAVWQVIDEIMMYMRNPMKYYNRRVALPRGILISGPPGTGKTLLARAIARESGLPFVFASGAEFVESSTGTGTDKVFDIFFTARANAPAFVFIDEIDALAGKNAKDDAERRATFEQLLSELDGEPEDTDVDRFAPRQAVILICATNRPDELDEQFMQPGRIDREIYIGLPGERERLGIFEVHSQGKRVAKDVDFSKLVFRTIGYSGADIRNLINEAGIMAVRKGHEEISQQDLVEVLDKQLFEGMGVVLMDEELKRVEQKVPRENKRLLAVHEAGHLLLAHLFPSFDWHAFSHLLPGGSEAALSVFYPREEMLKRGHTTVGYVKMQMVVAHGGRCAERLIFGNNISDGGQDDLARISAMARELTISPANRYLGLLPMKWRDTLDPPKPPGEVDLVPREWDKPGTQIRNMSVELSELFTREVTRYADEAEEIAMTALSQNRHILEKLADVLLSNTKLTGFEAEDIIKSMNPVLLPDFMCNDFKISLTLEQEVPPASMTGRYEELNIYAAPLHRS